MLDLEVVPERSLGGGQWEFVLGMPLAQAVEVMRRQCSVIKNVQVTYSEQRPLDMDVVIDLTDDGFKLLFDPKCQRLKMIEVYDVKKVKLKYSDKCFCSPEVPPTVEQIHETFGPTLPGQVDTKQQLYLLSFRGILFVFPILNAAGLTSDGPNFTELDSQRSLVLSRVCIFSGNDRAEAKAPGIPLECFHGNCYADRVEVVREGGQFTGLRLQLIADVSDVRPRVFEQVVRFGDSPQEVTRALGSPSKEFFKAEDKMRIHSPSPHKLPTTRCSDYFFNYFTLGLDVLFDAATHKAKKFVMHTNIPGHFNFNIYYRCNFLVSFPVDQQYSGDSSLTTVSITPAKVE